MFDVMPTDMTKVIRENEKTAQCSLIAQSHPKLFTKLQNIQNPFSPQHLKKFNKLKEILGNMLKEAPLERPLTKTIITDLTNLMQMDMQ